MRIPIAAVCILSVAQLSAFRASAQPAVLEVNPGPEGSSPGSFTVFDDHLYFTARMASRGVELWRTDGALVEPVSKDLDGSSPTVLTVYDEHLYFETYIDTELQALWRTNGDKVDLIRYLPFEDVSNRPLLVTGFRDAVYFASGDYGMSGYSLWKSSGPGDAQRLEEVQPVHGWPESYLNGWTAMDDALYFSGFDDAHGSELWRTDGTATERVADLNPGLDGSSPTGLMASGQFLYFAANDGLNGEQLYRTDGGALVRLTSIPHDASPSISRHPIAAFEGGVFFHANDGDTGIALWYADATGAVRMLGNPTDSRPVGLGFLEGYYYFWTRTRIAERPLWRTNGTTVELVAEVDPGGGAGAGAVAYDGYLYLKADGGLWRTNGSGGETVVSFGEGSRGYPMSLALFDGKIYMTGWDPEHGEEIWIYDPETQGSAVSHESDHERPETFYVSEAYPNPFNPSSSLLVRVSRSEHVRAELFAVDGSHVATLYDGTMASGSDHRLEVDGAELPSGIYFIIVDGESFTQARKAILVK